MMVNIHESNVWTEDMVAWVVIVIEVLHIGMGKYFIIVHLKKHGV